MGGVLGWLWETLEELMEEGQDWMVVTLVGQLGRLPSNDSSRGSVLFLSRLDLTTLLSTLALSSQAWASA